MQATLGVELLPIEISEIERDTQSILQRLSKIGYEAIESLFLQGVAERLRESGLAMSALHIVPTPLNDYEDIVSFLKSTNCSDIVISGPMDWYERSAADFEKTSDFLNHKAAEYKREDITIHYHNHDFEFDQISTPSGHGITTGFEILLDRLDLTSIGLCVDTGWVWMAKHDPVEFLAQHAQSIFHLHLRDFKNGMSCVLGQGEMDLGSVMHQVESLPKLKWIIVEHDPGSSTPLDDLSMSRQFLADKFSI